MLTAAVVTCALGGADVKVQYVWNNWAGFYTGEVDTVGAPYGYGLFDSTTPMDGVLWRYIGEWKDGQPNGTGTIYFDNCCIETGTYENGVLIKGERYTVTGLKKEEIKPVTGEDSSEAAYIGNKKSMRFHRPNCHSVAVMKDSNKVELASREEAIGRGFIPCGDCNP
ncbi:MAG: hypothetical protein Q4G19_02710 [Clostridia bacterium]|nr:hypothetical protein [Clostridia bacterium]